MRKTLALGAAVLFTSMALANAGAESLRQSPEFDIAAPGHPDVMLSSFKGKVVVLEFMFVRSQHCQRVAQLLNKLNGELGSQGFQPVAVVFDPPTGSTAGSQVIDFLQNYLKLTYPVGYASKDAVDAYLGRAPGQILNIPQLVVVDRGGRIRAATGGGDANITLEDESLLRGLLEQLLREGSPVSDTHRINGPGH
jgi:thiol-disulfide isomerase/thioredoxin